MTKIIIDTNYFKKYRLNLGFTNQKAAKIFFAAKDIVPTINYEYIEQLNTRLCEIIKKINLIVSEEVKINSIDDFIYTHLFSNYEKIKQNEILHRLNNQGRRPEEVYFSWMRGFLMSNYFIKGLAFIFDKKENEIITIGDDDPSDIKSFKRTPKADLEITGYNLRIEVQSGFQGINDIKLHKVLEAKRIFDKTNKNTLAIHFDIYNGQVAFILLDTIEDNDVNWITRQQMEGQTVFNIGQNFFIWKLAEKPSKFKKILEALND